MVFDALNHKILIVSQIRGIQPSKDPLEVLVVLVTRLKAKNFKEVFNRLLQHTWVKVDFKRIYNNIE